MTESFNYMRKLQTSSFIWLYKTIMHHEYIKCVYAYQVKTSLARTGLSGHEIFFEKDNTFSLLLLNCWGNNERFVSTLVPLKG